MKNCKVQKLYTILAPVLVFVSLLFSCPLFVHGSSTTKQIPYNYSWYWNNIGSSNYQTMIDNASQYIDVSDSNTVIFWTELGDNSILWQYCVAHVHSASPSVSWDQNLLNNSITLTFDRSYIGFTNFDHWEDANQDYAPTSWTFFGSDVSSFTNFGFTQFSHMPIFGNVTVGRSFTGSDAIVVITDSIIPYDPVEPSWPEDPDPLVPTPNPPNPPSNPTVENLLSYIGDLINYYGTYWRNRWNNNLKQWFKNVISNIREGFDNLYSNISNFFKPFFDSFLTKFNEIITNIKDYFTSSLSFLSDIKDAVQNVKKFFDHIIDLGSSNGQFSLTTLFVNLFIPSSADVKTAFEDSDTFGLISFGTILWYKILEIRSNINSLSATKVLHVPSLIYHGQQIGDYDISFAWFDNYKVYSDGIISAFLIFTYFWFLFFRLPTFIRGQGQLSGIASSVAHSSVNNGGDHT